MIFLTEFQIVNLLRLKYLYNLYILVARLSRRAATTFLYHALRLAACLLTPTRPLQSITLWQGLFDFSSLQICNAVQILENKLQSTEYGTILNGKI